MRNDKDNSVTVWRYLCRLTHFVYVLVKHASKYSINRVSGPKSLRCTLEEMGGSFIKLGQMMAFQPDVFPSEYCEALLGLVDQVPTFEFEYVEQTMLEDLGKRPLELFDSFGPRPFATGSIGQVHLAVLNGRRIAVKVRRPSVERDFSVDLNLIRLLIKLIRISHMKWFYWLIEPLTEFVSWTAEELDYRYEASYTEQLAANAKTNSHEHVPTVFREYTTKRILATDYLEAITILDYLRARDTGQMIPLSKADEFNPTRFAASIVHNFIGDALRHGVFHADLHPGNLMIMPGNKVGYIDFGIVGRLSPYSRYYLISMTLAYTRGDLEEVCTSFFKVSKITQDSDVEGFRQKLSILSRDWYAPGEEQTLRKSITQVMLDLLDLSRATNIWPRKEVIRYIRSAVVLDGLIKSFAPQLDLGRELEHLCTQHYLWYELQDLLTSKEGMANSLQFVADAERELARQELGNLQDAIQHFGLIDLSKTSNADIGHLISLNERIQIVARMERFEALWATEGLGFQMAEAALKVNQCPLQLLSCHQTSALPVSSRAAIHVGISLSVAKRLLNAAMRPDGKISLNQAVRNFVELCESRSPEGCGGVAVEALGFAARTLSPHWVNSIDIELCKIDRNLISYFWHGVGRGLYFLFPPILYSQDSHSIALERAWQDPPHDTGRVNSLAGLAWPLTLVNIRHPEILASFLRRNGAQMPGNGAFSSGIATSILLWLAWAGKDEYLVSLMNYQPEPTSFSDTTWCKFVTEPCLQVVKYHHQALNETRRYGELFCYQPLGALALRLTALNERKDHRELQEVTK